METANTAGARQAETERHDKVMEDIAKGRLAQAQDKAKGGKGPSWLTNNEVNTNVTAAKAALSQVRAGKLSSPDGKSSIDLKGMNRKHVGDVLISHGVDDALVIQSRGF